MYKTELGSSNTALSDVVYIGHAGFRMGGERATPTEMRDEVTAPLGASIGSRPRPRSSLGSSLERTRVMEPSMQQQMEEWRVPRASSWFPSQPFWVGLIAGALAVMLLASIGRWRFSQDGNGNGNAGGEQRAELTALALDRIATSGATFQRVSAAPAPGQTAPGETKEKDVLAGAEDAQSDDDPPAFLVRRLAPAESSAPPVEERPASAAVARRSQRPAGVTAKARAGVRRTAADGAVAGAAAPPEAAVEPPPLAKPAPSGWVDPWAD
jgi:hypothetical protein